MKCLLIEELVLKNKIYEAKYFMQKNNLEDKLSDYFKQLIEDADIEISEITELPDKFGPVSQGLFLKIPTEVTLTWID